MARLRDRRFAGVSFGGVLVIAGLIVALTISHLLGIIVIVVGLAAFGGFAKGKWY